MTIGNRRYISRESEIYRFQEISPPALLMEDSLRKYIFFPESNTIPPVPVRPENQYGLFRSVIKLINDYSVIN